MIDILGWIAGILFAFCGLPQAIRSRREGHSEGLHSITLTMWASGEVLSLAYVYLKHGLDWPLLFNYGVNLIFLVIIIKYKIWPRRSE